MLAIEHVRRAFAPIRFHSSVYKYSNPADSSFVIPSKPLNDESFAFRKEGPINCNLQELFSRNLTKYNKIDFFSDHDKSIWGKYAFYGLGVSCGAGFLLTPILGLFMGSYFTIMGGFLAQARKKFFGNPEDFLTSPASELFENVLSYSLIVNAELAIEPWKSDLLDKYDETIQSLTTYTALQQLLVKEPIIDRTEKPRVVSASSVVIIWKNLMEESVFHVSESNPWQNEIQKDLIGKYLIYLKPRLHPYIVEQKFGVDVTIDKRFLTFDAFYERFHEQSLNMLSQSCNCSTNAKRTNIYVLLSGVLFSLPLLMLI